jgi:hypothetical protein
VRYAAAVAHVDRRTIYSWRLEDSEFRAAWNAAKEEAVDQVENTLYEMAKSGKNVVATIFYLKANRVQYRDRLSIDLPAVQRELEESVAQLVARDGSKSQRDLLVEVLKPASN